jgi:glucose/arabinose dehydrogenase
MRCQQASLDNETKILFAISTSFTLLTSFFYPFIVPIVQASDESSNAVYQIPELPNVFDIGLKVEIFSRGLNFPTSIAFLGPDDILVLEKNNGQVRRIINGSLLPDPLLDLNISNQSERGMLGIAVQNNENNKSRPTAANVFLYFTETLAQEEDKDNQVVRNSLYKYQFIDNKLINPKKLLELPSSPGPAHNGGSITIGPDNNVYITTGNLNQNEIIRFLTRAENFENGQDPDGRAGILRITQDGQPVPNGSIIGDQYPLNLYYAYGIRNSFGMDFDPVTGNLWDTENGPSFGDEINLVKPGFNSGWNKVQGIWERSGGSAGAANGNPQGAEILVDFNGRGEYSDPEFIWKEPVSPTAISFLDSDKLGKEYENDIFVGDFRNGTIYHFDLNKDRTQLSLNGSLADKIADAKDELKTSLFGRGFGAITDLKVGPDGYLYVLSLFQSGNDCEVEIIGNPCLSYNSTSPGTIFRIVPETVASAQRV